jgi:hypothetical protein
MDTTIFEPVEEDDVMVALKGHNVGFTTAFAWGDDEPDEEE